MVTYQKNAPKSGGGETTGQNFIGLFGWKSYEVFSYQVKLNAQLMPVN